VNGHGGYGNGVSIEVEPHEAATGAAKAVWLPPYGNVTVPVPPGTVDGTVVRVPLQGGELAVMVRVRAGAPLPPPPAFPPPPPPGHPQAHQLGPMQPGPMQPGPMQPGPMQHGPMPFAAPGAAKGRRTTQFIAYGVAAVLVAGCCAGLRFLPGDDDEDVATNRNTAVAATGTPVSVAQYAQVLATADAAIKAEFPKLATQDEAALGAAATATAGAIEAEVERLRATVPPDDVERTHAELLKDLTGLAEMAGRSAAEKPVCPTSSPYDELVRSGWAHGIRDDAKTLAEVDAGLAFGSFLPAARKNDNRRLANGTYVKRPGGSGRGSLEIKNGPDDATISLVPTSGKTPLFTVYVRSGGRHKVRNVKNGRYTLYTATGSDWDAERKGFTVDCGFSKMDEPFDFDGTTSWTVTLTQVVGGNASSSDVDPGSFPTG
jgi:hypothetical protein